ncbi:MAG: hypothetical protein V8T86_00910 [Victivallis sp.]
MNTDFKAKSNAVYRVSFRARASVAGRLTARAYQAGGGWSPLGNPPNVTVDLSPEWRDVIWNCRSTLDWNGRMRLPSLSFGGFPAGAVVSVGPVTVEELMPFRPLPIPGRRGMQNCSPPFRLRSSCSAVFRSNGGSRKKCRGGSYWKCPPHPQPERRSSCCMPATD